MTAVVELAVYAPAAPLAVACGVVLFLCAEAFAPFMRRR